MLLYLPCSRFRIRYSLSIGSPYSELDRLILRSVGEGVHTIEELSDTFKLNTNLLIQSLVTLTQVGWLALGDSSDVQFTLTIHGENAIKNKQIPKSIIFRADSTDVLLERVTACLIPQGEVTYVNTRHVEIKDPWNHPQFLKPEISQNSLEEGEIQHLLPRRLGERLHWIEKISVVSRDFEYVPLDVDIEKEQIINFPLQRSSYLREKVMDFAKELARDQRKGLTLSAKKPLSLPRAIDRSVFKLPEDTYSVSWTDGNLLSDTEDMFLSLLDALDSASKYLLVASREMSLSTLKEIEQKLVAAINRGVKVDILWGNHADGESLDFLGKLAYTIGQEGSLGQLLFNKEPCNFNAALIIFDKTNFDKSKSTFEAIISNHNWLSSTIEYEVTPEFGFRINHPDIIASVARSVAGYASDITSHSMRAFVNKWKRIASEIPLATLGEGEDSDKGEEIQLRLVQSSYEHLETLLKFTEGITQRFYILSSFIDVTGKGRLTNIPIFGNSAIKSAAIIGNYIEGDHKNEANTTKTVEIDYLQEYEGLNTNIIVSDDAVCITSCPPLLGIDPVREKRNLGIVIYGQGPAQSISNHINASFISKR